MTEETVETLYLLGEQDRIMVRKEVPAGEVMARPGFADLPAVCHGAVYEIKSPLILQPGPAALTDGLAALRGIVDGWVVSGAGSVDTHPRG